MVHLELRLLGVPEILLDAQPVVLRRRHSLALLAYLLLTRRAHARDALATLLTDDLPTERANKVLRNALADLNEQGIGPYVVRSRQAIRFNSDLPHSLDVDRIEDVLQIPSLHDAAAFDWGDAHCDRELLAGLTLRDAPLFETWLVTEREHVRQQLDRLAMQLLSGDLRERQLAEGIGLAHRLVQLAPWNEEMHRVLMRLLARDGQLSAALAQYERCRVDVQRELDAEPQPETVALFEQLRSGPRPPRRNLPTPSEGGALIGRQADIDALTAALMRQSRRLVTIVGTGGSGKSALALAVAEAIAVPVSAGHEHPFADGIFLVNLAEIAPPDQPHRDLETVAQECITAIGLALGMVFYGNVDRREQIVAFLAEQRVLLILDNAEHVAATVPDLRDILHRAPGVALLVTSRTALGVGEEWQYELGGLASDPSDVERSPAGQLFLRESQVPSQPLSFVERASLLRICKLTGGLPLALKIAAGWRHALSLAAIADELEHGGALLSEPAVGHHARPLSIRSMARAACERLPAREQQALLQLSVFPGQFDGRAAEAVGVSRAVLAPLCRRALVERTTDDGYLLHPLIRQCAVDALVDRVDEAAAARAAHAAHFAALLAQLAPGMFRVPDAHAALGQHLADLRLAWDSAIECGDRALIGQLWSGMVTWYLFAGLYREWTALLEPAIACIRAYTEQPDAAVLFVELLAAQAESLLWLGELDRALLLLDEARSVAGRLESVRLDALISLGTGRLLRFRGGEDARATSCLERAVDLAHAGGDRRVEAQSLMSLAFAVADREDYASAEVLVGNAQTAYRGIDDRHSVARTAHLRGRLLATLGDYDRGRIETEQSLHVARAFGDQAIEGLALTYLGIIEDRARGRHRLADEHFSRAFVIAQLTGDPHLHGNVLRAWGRNALHAGSFEQADELFDRAVSTARDVGNRRALSDALLGLGQVAIARGDAGVAEDRANQVLSMAEDIGHRHTRASALFLSGLVLRSDAQLLDADHRYGQALDLAHALQLKPLERDLATARAEIALRQGEPIRALRFFDDVLPAIFDTGLAGFELLGWTTMIAYRILDAVGDARATDVLRRGAQALERRATGLPAPQRARYLLAFPERQAVVRCWKEYAVRAEGQAPPVFDWVTLPLVEAV